MVPLGGFSLITHRTISGTIGNSTFYGSSRYYCGCLLLTGQQSLHHYWLKMQHCPERGHS